MLLTVKNLTKQFPLPKKWFKKKQFVHALNDVSFSIRPNEVVGVVGESGCGKSTLARLLVRLLSPSSGQILFEETPIQKLSSRELKPFRKKMQMVFQDPYASLNPRHTVGQILGEGLKIHKLFPPDQIRSKVLEWLERIGLSPRAFDQYPHQFSGGQRQRIGIARALSLLPQFLICDEPVSALDVSIQAQILNLLVELKKQFQLTYLFISHDLRVVHWISDRILVMYLGKIVEELPSNKLFQAGHPYTQALLSAIPNISSNVKKKTAKLETEITSSITLPSGCFFHPRCSFAEDVCRKETPLLMEKEEGHRIACHLREKIEPIRID